MRSGRAGLGAALLAAMLAGCGGMAPGLSSTTGTVRAADDHDVIHAKLNAIVREVLQGQWPHLLATADADGDARISRGEYAGGRDGTVTELFMQQFDANRDGRVAGAEYGAALQATDSIEAYHHVTEERMERAIAPYVADQHFDFSELRSYLTRDLGLTGDFPYVGRLFGQLDLNEDEKLLSGKGEGPAFLLMFARPQLQRALGLPVAPVR